MAAFAIKASAVFCTQTMGIIGRPRQRCERYVPCPAGEARKKRPVPSGGETDAATRTPASPDAPSLPRWGRLLQQALAGPDDRELYRLCPDVKALLALSHHGED